VILYGKIFILDRKFAFSMDWEIIGRPGFAGDKKSERQKSWNKQYGEGNWRIAWVWNGSIIEREFAFQLYEDAYYADSFEREDLWGELLGKAKDIYDHNVSNINSGLDYSIQEGRATHLQDISVRRVVARRGWKFEGDELIQIRSHSDYWGDKFSPGRISFHLPALIEKPNLESWWDVDSIEDFYQSNKVLLRRK
jgi:hypothetical protein